MSLAAIAALLLGLYLAPILLLALVGYHGLFLQRTKSPRESRSAALERGHFPPDFLELGWEEFSLPSPRGFALKGCLLASKDPAAPTVLLIHGITWDRHFALKYAQCFVREGWNVASMDLAGHGLSEAPSREFPSFGVKEKFDAAAVLGFLAGRFPESRGFGLVGESLGAATALQCAALEPGAGIPAPAFVVADCSFSEISEELVYQLERRGLPRWIAAQSAALVSFAAQRRRGFVLAEASPLAAAAKAAPPVLFVHGARDRFVPASMSVAMYDARVLAGLPAELFLMPGAGHGKSWNTAPQAWERLVLDFAARALAGAASAEAPRGQAFPLTEPRPKG